MLQNTVIASYSGDLSDSNLEVLPTKKQGASIVPENADSPFSGSSARDHLTHYPGGKNANGVFHQIINKISASLQAW